MLELRFQTPFLNYQPLDLKTFFCSFNTFTTETFIQMNLNRTSLVFVCASFVIALIGCTKDNEQVSILIAEKNQLSADYETQLAETRASLQRADSLQTVVHDLEQEVEELKGNAPVYNASNADEEAIENLVKQLHQGWSSMFKSNNTQDVLQYFLPEYTTSAIRVDVENVPSVRRKNDHTFEQFLQQLVDANNVELTFGETKFLYLEVKGDFFVTSYRTTIRIFDNNKLRHTGSIVTQLAGQKAAGEWKVGNYHWVNFNY